MCGIIGFIDLSLQTSSGKLQAIAAGMADTLRHRGPDDMGTWVDERAGITLGHRRLSIIDLSMAGHQPMHSVCCRYVMVFNGEIYNYKEIRLELEEVNGFLPKSS
jgi:asparagine synthase (glutamine-hydrolysing)